jgi:hypothetical protein
MRIYLAAFVVAVFSLLQTPCRAQGSSGGFFEDWFERVDKTQADQPHWVTPIATTTPRLEEEFRYDILWQTNNSGITSQNSGGSKGIELIPAERVEVILVAGALLLTLGTGMAQSPSFGDVRNFSTDQPRETRTE